jgi:hypothetical protein
MPPLDLPALKEYVWAALISCTWRVLYHVAAFYILNAPKWAGGFAGVPAVDVCSTITGIPTSSLILADPKICEERITTYIGGYTTLLLVAVSLAALRELVPLVRIVIPAYLARLDKQKLDKIKQQRYARAAEVGKVTKENNAQLLSLAQSVVIAMSADVSSEAKVKFIAIALSNISADTAKKILYEPTSACIATIGSDSAHEE